MIEWFGDPGHFIGARDCRYHLHTHVNGYCISTVGEYRPSGGLMEQVGHERLYETMVFPADKYRDDAWDELWMEPYNTADEANAGHAMLVAKYAAMEPCK